MKKLLVFLFAFVYIASSCEATVYLHYCMGKQVGFSLIPGRADECQRCGMKKAGKGMDCCKDEQKIVTSDKTQKVTDLNNVREQEKKFTTIIQVFPDYLSPSIVPGNVVYHYANGPPRSGQSPVYLLNCVFRI